jgi:hypothetical protein
MKKLLFGALMVASMASCTSEDCKICSFKFQLYSIQQGFLGQEEKAVEFCGPHDDIQDQAKIYGDEYNSENYDDDYHFYSYTCD